MGKLFGTDGIRGVANVELTCDLAFRVGQAAAMVLAGATGHRARFLIGKDTRISSDMIESALAAGIVSVGADAALIGVVPTPAVAHMTIKTGADAGIVISASHNPMEFNGIKIFSDDGYKLSDALEEQIETILFGSVAIPLKTGAEVGRIARWEVGMKEYCNDIKYTAQNNLNGLKLLIDCANGAAYQTAKEIFPALYADCTFIHDKPDGVNINRGCGSTHLNSLRELMRSGEFDVGIAFDGDADRCIAVDETGEVIDGDQIMALCAADLKERGELDGDAFVATVMSNLGLHRFAEEHGISIATSPVGDRNVLNLMQAEDYILGGEQSGHVIFKKFSTTGDGQLTAVQFLSLLKRRKMRASELRAEVPKFPQAVVNVDVANELKETVTEDRDVKAAIREVSEQLGDAGRILVRPSGTEPIVRVMVEAEDSEQVKAIAEHVADIIASAANAIASGETAETGEEESV